jgi:hypothetical protein
MRVAGALLMPVVGSCDMLITLIIIDPGPCSVRRNGAGELVVLQHNSEDCFSFKNMRMAEKRTRASRVVLTRRRGVYSTCFYSSPPPEILTPWVTVMTGGIQW